MKHPCLIPPEGWACCRGAGHPGPCAASRVEEWCGPLSAEEQALIDAAWEKHKADRP